MSPGGLRAEKQVLQDFYDLIGWHKNGQETSSFVDSLKWEDLRPVASEYIHNCHLRVNRYIKNEGSTCSMLVLARSSIRNICPTRPGMISGSVLIYPSLH